MTEKETDYYDEEIERLKKIKEELLTEEQKRAKLNQLSQQITEIKKRKKKGFFSGKGGSFLDRMATGVSNVGDQLNKTVGGGK